MLHLVQICVFLFTHLVSLLFLCSERYKQTGGERLFDFGISGIGLLRRRQLVFSFEY